MRLFWLYYILFFLMAPFNDCSAQNNSRKVDSLARAIDSSAKAVRKWQNRFKAKQDSAYIARIKKPEGNNEKYIPANTYSEPDKGQYLGRYVFAGALIILVPVLILAFKKYRRRSG